MRRRRSRRRRWRPLAYAGATLFGLATGGLRVTFGGHFVSDVIVAGLVTFLLIWLVHGLLYRWPSTRTTDERIEAALTRAGVAGIFAHAAAARPQARVARRGQRSGSAERGLS